MTVLPAATLRLVAGIVLLAWALHGHAGTACAENAAAAGTISQGLALAQKVVALLDGTGVRVALVARVGQDLSRYKLRYSHFAFAVRDHAEGRWSVVHSLNHCGTAKAGLYVQGMGNFFADDVFAYEAAILLLPSELQARLEKVLASPVQLRRFHEERYSAVAYPFNTVYQNSNQWCLETLAGAMAPEGDVVTRAEAQGWLQQEGYQPTLLQLTPMTRLGGRMFKAHIAFDDHPGEYRWSDRIYVVSVESVFEFLRRRYPHDSQRRIVALDDR